MEIGRNKTVFPNGAMIVTVTTADVTPGASPSDPPTIANRVDTVTVTPKMDPLTGAPLMPPGAPEGAIVAAAIQPTPQEIADAHAAAAASATVA